MNRKDIEKEYSLAISDGGSTLINQDDLSDLISKARSRNKRVAILESFRLENNLEIPCLEYGIYWGEFDDQFAGRAGGERAEYIESKVREILKKTRLDGREYAFNIWLTDV